MSKRTSVYLVLELFIVMVGMVAGLVLNEARENSQHQNQAKQLLVGIRKEYAQNLAELETTITMQESYLDTLMSFQDHPQDLVGDQYGFFEKHMTFGGFRFTVPITSHWDLARQSRAFEFFPLDASLLLSKIHLLQEDHARRLIKSSDLFYDPAFFRPQDSIAMAGAMGILTNDLLLSEKKLTEMYQKFLGLLPESE